MTTISDGETWARDRDADANLSLMRKRPRISGEIDTSPLSSNDESIVVESVESQPQESSYENPIELHDDPGMDSFSESLTLYPNLSPMGQLDKALRKINGGYLLEASLINSLTLWIEHHLESTADQVILWQSGYLQDHDFFAKFGETMYTLLARDEDILARETSRMNARLRGTVEQLYVSLTTLSIRILRCLPGIIRATNARRDSANTSAPRQRSHLLWYIQILAQILAFRNIPASKHFQERLAFDPCATAALCHELLHQEPLATAALIELFKRHGCSPTETAESWQTLDATLCLVLHTHFGGNEALESLLDTVQTHLLPVICEKHPRALPEMFAEHFIQSTSHIVKSLTLATDFAGASIIYTQYIRADDDAMLPEPGPEASLAEAIKAEGDGSQQIVAELMTTAWTLRALKRFVASDIMDVRSLGITLLSTQLVHVFQQYHSGKSEAEHPVVQYVGRFMRVNELTKYIFGPSSHASLVSHSQEIIGFLAATGAYTNLETDIIWHACTNSVEAEFVKASFLVLGKLLEWLDRDHLVYIAEKYTTTPPAKLGRYAVETFADIINRLTAMAEKSQESCDLVVVPLISIDVLKRMRGCAESASSTHLSQLAKAQLMRFTQRCLQVQERGKVFRKCVPDVLDHAEGAETNVEIINMFLKTQTNGQEAEDFTAALPPASALGELINYVERLAKSQSGTDDNAFTAISLRIEALLRLMTITSTTTLVLDWTLLSTLYRHIIGESAVHNGAREAAWMTLVRLTAIEKVDNAAADITRHFAFREAMNLPSEHVTPQLIRLWSDELGRQIVTEPANDFLFMPLWQKLVDTAESIVAQDCRRFAVDEICKVLFGNYLQDQQRQTGSLHEAQFTRQQVMRVHRQYCAYVESDSKEDCEKVVRGIDLLSAVLQASRHALHSRTSDHTPTVDIPGPDAAEKFTYRMFIQGLGDQPNEARLVASKATTMADLFERLPEITGALDHRIIVAGHAIDPVDEGAVELAETAASTSKVILVCPRHSFADDLHKIFKPRGQVEHVLSSEFELLETLLGGQEQIASQMYNLLSTITPPITARNRISSADTTVDDLFPPSKVWQTVYSTVVLRVHLHDFLRLGVLDSDYLVRSMRQLVATLLDEDRAVRPELHINITECLIRFLQEYVPESPITPFIDDAVKFTSRMIDLCFYGLGGLPNHSASISVRMACSALECLLLAARKQPSVWQAFTQNDRIMDLHVGLLLHVKSAIAANSANSIRVFCQDPNIVKGAEDVYMNVLLGILPTALQSGHRCLEYFEIITETTLANPIVQADEAIARTLVRDIMNQLWSYEHTESVDLPLLDFAMFGMLKLLSATIDVLRSFKKPLHLTGFANTIFRRLLFPTGHDSDPKPLVDPRTRHLAYVLATTTCDFPAEFKSILDDALLPLSNAKHEPCASYPGRDGWLRPAWKCSGLTNLGMTCYMNSLLQQLFANVQFRLFIFETPIENVVDQSLLVEVQKLFGHMQNDYNCVADTRALAENLGVVTENQEDVHGFYEDFLARLESCMPDEASKLRLNRFFTGKLISQIKGECGHVSPRPEAFVDLPVIVKNKTSLHDSLEEFVQGEPMEGTNQYRCQSCDPDGGGRLVNAMKRACPEELPDNVTFCLKRFTFEAMLGLDGKVNDRFEFPQNIDLSRYLRTHLEHPERQTEADMFELVGVIVHQGTLQIGHYWSYTLLRNSRDTGHQQWVKLEDGNVSTCVEGLAEVQRECFGGQTYLNGNERSDNAYVLFYQRKSTFRELVAPLSSGLGQENATFMPPRVPVPPSLHQEVHEVNAWRHEIAHLFDDDFGGMVEWLLQHLRPHLTALTSSTESRSSQDEDGSCRTSPASDTWGVYDDLIEKISRLGMDYILRVATCDPKPVQKLGPILNELMVCLAEQPRLASGILISFFRQLSTFTGIMSHSSAKVRSMVLTLILKCMACLRDQDPSVYGDILDKVKMVYGVLLKNYGDLPRMHWASLFDFAARLAQEGAEETAIILDSGSLCWAFEVLLNRAHARPSNPGLLELVQDHPDRIAALYEFINAVLSGHVDLSERTETRGPHEIGENGVLLQAAEFAYLNAGAVGTMAWIWTARYAETKFTWRDFAPGKLMATVMKSEDFAFGFEHVERSLLAYIEKEDDNLETVFQLTLRFCAECAQDQDACKVFNGLANTIHMWNAHVAFLTFMHEAHQLVPWTAAQSTELWCRAFLLHRVRRVRNDTAEWLREALLRPEPMTENATLDACRIRQVRKIIAWGCTEAQNGYHSEQPKAKYEPLLSVLHATTNYLKALHAMVKAHHEVDDEGVKPQLSFNLITEYDESKSALSTLENCLQEVADWVSEDVILRSPPDEPPKSIETVTDEAESSGEENWEDGSEAA